MRREPWTETTVSASNALLSAELFIQPPPKEQQETHQTNTAINTAPISYQAWYWRGCLILLQILFFFHPHWSYNCRTQITDCYITKGNKGIWWFWSRGKQISPFFLTPTIEQSLDQRYAEQRVQCSRTVAIIKLNQYLLKASVLAVCVWACLWGLRAPRLWWLLVYFRASGSPKVKQWRSPLPLKSSTRPPAQKPMWSSWTWVFITQQFVSTCIHCSAYEL